MPRLENLVAAVLDTHVWVWTCAGDARAHPADRLIVATAIECGVPLITADRQIIDWNNRHRLLQLFAL